MSFFRKLRSTLENSRQDRQGVLNPVFRNDGSEVVRFTSTDETHVKTSSFLDDPQPGPSTQAYESTLPIEKQHSRTIFSWLTFTLFTIIILGAFTAVVIVIVAFRDPTPPNQKKAPVCISEVEIPLMNNIVIKCELNDYKSEKLAIAVTTPQVNSTPMNLVFGSSLKNGTWTMNMSSVLSVQIWGPKTQCNSYGTYQINFTVPGKDVATQHVTIAMPNNLRKVDLMLDRTTSCFADSNNTDILVSCAMWSGCNLSSLNLMPISETGYVSDFDFPFKCKTNYTNAKGWYVNCSGWIENTLARKITQVQCYPSSGLPETKRLEPCNLAGSCTVKDKRLGENISIICNLLSDLGTNLSVTFSYVSPSNETVLLTNETEVNKEWTPLNYTTANGKLTITGPRARCSSAGKYLINIIDTSTKKNAVGKCESRN